MIGAAPAAAVGAVSRLILLLIFLNVQTCSNGLCAPTAGSIGAHSNNSAQKNICVDDRVEPTESAVLSKYYRANCSEHGPQMIMGGLGLPRKGAKGAVGNCRGTIRLNFCTHITKPA
ncbi:hypothetical protein FA15DRAFT_657035 [Coprinopsis marcescibilis]|uniref:Hydrophobin n=1 Tax=Coprinopsis marcescibilis TaxID=230819 RepID=A0A5C3KS09_COPMA|nr:hypothetical protein FA15DRAFT_657035 [Coprinopsis marcescibilis]